jgi:hypothetical protein
MTYTLDGPNGIGGCRGTVSGGGVLDATPLDIFEPAPPAAGFVGAATFFTPPGTDDVTWQIGFGPVSATGTFTPEAGCMADSEFSITTSIGTDADTPVETPTFVVPEGSIVTDSGTQLFNWDSISPCCEPEYGVWPSSVATAPLPQ